MEGLSVSRNLDLAAVFLIKDRNTWFEIECAGYKLNFQLSHQVQAKVIKSLIRKKKEYMIGN